MKRVADSQLAVSWKKWLASQLFPDSASLIPGYLLVAILSWALKIHFIEEIATRTGNFSAREADIFVTFDEGCGAVIKENDCGFQSGQPNSRQQHPAARDVANWRTKAREATGGLRSDAAGDRSDREGVVFSSNRPTYGTVRAGTGVSAVGVHYSQAQRERIATGLAHLTGQGIYSNLLPLPYWRSS